MSVDTRTFMLKHQILDFPDVLVTLSGIEAREIIEDFLADALVEGDNISIVYTDVPAPGIVTIGTTQSLAALNVTASGVVYVGTALSVKQLEDNNIAMGFGDIGLSMAPGATHNIFIGLDAGRSITTSDYNIAIGTETLYSNNMDNNNIAIGHQACRNGNTNNSDNVFIGYQAGYQANGDYMICIGPYAGRSGVGNLIAMGNGAGRYATGATNSILIGAQACYWGNGASNNLVIGHFAAYGVSGQSSGDYNTFIGQSTGRSFTSGGRNVCLGHEAGYYFTTEYDNVLIGYYAGRSNTGGHNTIIGSSAGYTGDGSYNIFIGYQAGYNETGSNKLYIANSNTATPLIYGEFDTPMLQFNGDIYFGANTISGTGDIYCNDLYTSGSTVHIGDLLELSADDSGNLEVNYGIVVDGVDSSLEFVGSTATIGLSGDADLLTLVSGTVGVAGNITPTVSGIGDVGAAQKPWNQVYLLDQATSDVYNVTIVSGTLVATLV